MELSNLLNPAENRFNYAEGNKPIENALIGTLKTIVRGGIIGGFIGLIKCHGESEPILNWAGIGLAIDVAQDAIRKINLKTLRRNDSDEYSKHKKAYLNFLNKLKY